MPGLPRFSGLSIIRYCHVGQRIGVTFHIPLPAAEGGIYIGYAVLLKFVSVYSAGGKQRVFSAVFAQEFHRLLVVGSDNCIVWVFLDNAQISRQEHGPAADVVCVHTAAA